MAYNPNDQQRFECTLAKMEKDPLQSAWTGGDLVLYNAGVLLSKKILMNNMPCIIRDWIPSGPNGLERIPVLRRCIY
jgi:hypothetical protein